MDINLNQIAQLIAIAEQADIDELEIGEGHRNIRITCRSAHCRHPNHHGSHHRHPHGDYAHTHTSNDESGALTSPVLFSKSTKPVADLPLTAQAPQAANTPALAPENQSGSANSANAVTSPMVGTFYRKSSPDAPAFVEVGQRVNAGDTLCIIEAMKIMHEVKAEQAGVVREILVSDGDMVEYAQPILTLE